MSSVDVPIVRPTTEAAPKDYEIPAAQEIAPLAVRALVDGSGAATGFVPALQLIAPGGQVMWTAPTSETVAAGASADVSWFPRVGGGGGGGGGIDFDKVNTGEWLEIRTTGPGGGEGFYFLDTSGNGFFLQSTSFMQLIADPFQLISSGEISMNVGAAPAAAPFVIGLNAAGCKFEIVNHLGQPLLRVTESGTYHIKTGAAWVADL